MRFVFQVFAGVFGLFQEVVDALVGVGAVGVGERAQRAVGALEHVENGHIVGVAYSFETVKVQYHHFVGLVKLVFVHGPHALVGNNKFGVESFLLQVLQHLD